MPELPDGVGTGKSSPYGDKSGVSAFENKTVSAGDNGTNKSHPSPQNTHVELGGTLKPGDKYGSR